MWSIFTSWLGVFLSTKAKTVGVVGTPLGEVGLQKKKKKNLLMFSLHSPVLIIIIIFVLFLFFYSDTAISYNLSCNSKWTIPVQPIHGPSYFPCCYSNRWLGNSINNYLHCNWFNLCSSSNQSSDGYLSHITLFSHSYCLCYWFSWSSNMHFSRPVDSR